MMFRIVCDLGFFFSWKVAVWNMRDARKIVILCGSAFTNCSGDCERVVEWNYQGQRDEHMDGVGASG